MTNFSTDDKNGEVLAAQIEHAIDPVRCSYVRPASGVLEIAVHLRASEWRKVIGLLAQSATERVVYQCPRCLANVEAYPASSRVWPCRCGKTKNLCADGKCSPPMSAPSTAAASVSDTDSIFSGRTRGRA